MNATDEVHMADENSSTTKNKEFSFTKSTNYGINENPDSSVYTNKEPDAISSTVLEEEDSVLGGDDSAKDYDVNIDEDELLKDMDSDDLRGANSEPVNSETNPDVASLESVCDDSVGIDTQPQLSLDQGRQVESGDSIRYKMVCDSKTTSISISTSVKDIVSNEPNSQFDAASSIENISEPSSEKNLISDESPSNIEERKIDETNNTCHEVENKVLLIPCGRNNSSSDNTEGAESETCGDSLSETTNKFDPTIKDPTCTVSACEIKEGNKNETNCTAPSEDYNTHNISDVYRTNFLHVEQDTSRPDEISETGEDPFALTCDELLHKSDDEGHDESEKEDTVSGEAPMDVDEITIPVCTEPTSGNIVEGPEIVKVNVVVADKGSNEEHVAGTDSTSNLNTESMADSINKDLSVSHNTSTHENNKVQQSIDFNSDFNVSDTDKKRSDGSSRLSTSKITPKSKSTTISGKTKHKRRDSTEEDSDTSDFNDEINIPSVQRPKRSAAKKAESQIKVVRAVEEEVEREDANGTEDVPNSEKSMFSSQSILDITDDSDKTPSWEICYTCKKGCNGKISTLSFGKTKYFCDDSCFAQFRDGPLVRPGECMEIVPSSTVTHEIGTADSPPVERAAYIRKCSQCRSHIADESDKTLSWETMDFCSDDCLGKYQQELGSYCANCKGNVQPASLGKYCVRFGYEVKQFCCSSCLEEFKKGLKVCSFCQKDMSAGAEGFLAPVGEKGTFKDFCTPGCMEKYEQMSSNLPPPTQTTTCHVCNNVKRVQVQVFHHNKFNKLCSEICFNAYKFANNLSVDKCDMCRKYFDKEINGEKFNIFYEGVPHNFCCKTCLNVYILAKRKIVPCNWCKVKKYNFDMIKRILSTGQVLMMCSLNCMTLYQVSVNAVSSRRIKCDMCLAVAQAQYHLTMSDATIRNFCTYPCVMNFQQQYTKNPITLPGSDEPPIPTGAPVPVISSVTSLLNGQVPNNIGAKVPSGKLNLVLKLSEPPVCRNKNTQTRPIMNTKSVSCRPHSVSVESQTEDSKGRPVLIPIPIPIYVPCPMPMYSLPFPVPVPFPIPVPVPVFLPTTRNSIKGIMQEIKRIQEKLPSDPFEAELLMMAEMVAGDKKEEVTSSESEMDNEPAAESRANSDGGGADFSSGSIENSPTFGEDIMQIAFKMATEMDEPAIQMENQLVPPATMPSPTQTDTPQVKISSVEETKRTSASEERKAVKRQISVESKKRVTDIKKKKSNHSSVVNSAPLTSVVEEVKPDAHMKLKYTFGVNAWKSWVTQKSVEVEKLSSTNKKLKPLNTDILQLTADELNFSLCMFVREVQKPNGTQYAPDTIYYLCLGIQQYLYENGRIDNIFTDSYFEPFTDSLDEIAKKFGELFNDHQYIVTRVEEEHLWECKQLGAHSPHVLLSTLMFFNTKHFNLTTVDEHLMLSFSHIMKHWKRNSNQTPSTGSGKAPGSRNVLLRFYPPQAVLDDPNSKKKKVYEQQENDENPLRCPVKLYEFYLSKCPESVKSRSDVFYLQPERSCVPDSPVWYSTMALSKEPLEKMLNRVKMVKEINIALLLT